MTTRPYLYPTAAVAFLILSLASVVSQESAPVSDAAESAQKAEPDRVKETLTTLAEAFDDATRELEAAQQALEATPPEEREAAEARIEAAGERLAQLKKNLEVVATGLEPGALGDAEGKEFKLQSELEELIRPLVEELKSATEDSRELERLRSELSELSRQGSVANEAISRVDRLLNNSPSESLQGELEGLHTKWKEQLQTIETTTAVVQYRIDELEAKQGSLLNTATDLFTRFFKTRGRNLIVALLAAGLTALLLRFLWSWIERLPILHQSRLGFASRATAVLFRVGIVVLSIAAAMIVFYAASDWVLLGMSTLFLLGLAWAGKQTLPRFVEQLKLMLNIGPVREGERLVLDGVPWQVKSLRVSCELENPELEGGRLRLPLRDVVPLASRPTSTKELWFPCEAGSWVILSDGTRGKVVTQTPEWVQLVLIGGSRKTYQTSEFLTMNPENLSLGFRIRSTFGVDYEHQAIANNEIAPRLKEALESGLAEIAGEGGLVHVGVELESANSSSLDFRVLADFSGEVAHRYGPLSRGIQAICVDACNQHGWVIPFPQLTVHKAG